jgi:hypothetical protein
MCDMTHSYAFLKSQLTTQFAMSKIVTAHFENGYWESELNDLLYILKSQLATQSALEASWRRAFDPYNTL